MSSLRRVPFLLAGQTHVECFDSFDLKSKNQFYSFQKHKITASLTSKRRQYFSATFVDLIDFVENRNDLFVRVSNCLHVFQSIHEFVSIGWCVSAVDP